MSSRKLIILLNIICIFAVTSCKGIAFKNQKIATAEEFTKGEAMIFVAEQKNKYESRFGEELWTLKSGDGKLNFKDYIVDNVKKFIEKIMILKLAAKDLNVIIGSNDKVKLEALTNEYYSLLSPDDISYIECSYDDVRHAFDDFHTARLVVDNLSKGATGELSISEAKVIKVQYIVFDSLEKAKETKEKLKAKGASFAYFAKTRGINTEIEMIVKRGDETSTRFPELFYMSNGQVSDIFQYTNKYYIFKCVDDYMKEETELRRIEILKAMKNDEFILNFKKYEEKYNLKSNSSYWRQINLSNAEYCKIDKFEELYYSYFPKNIR